MQIGSVMRGSLLSSGSTTMKPQDERPESVSLRPLFMAYAHSRASGRIWTGTARCFHLAALTSRDRFGHRHRHPRVARRDSVGTDVLVSGSRSDWPARASLQTRAPDRGNGRSDRTPLHSDAARFHLSSRAARGGFGRFGSLPEHEPMAHSRG